MSDPTTPPPPSPPPPGPPPPGQPRQPMVRIGEWFGEAWNLIKPVWIEFVLVILLFQVIISVGFLFCVLPGLVLIGPLLGGVFVYCAKRVLQLPAEVTDLFRGFDRFVPTMILGLIIFLIPMAVIGIAFLPPLFAAVGMSAAESAGSQDLGELASATGGLSTCLTCVVVPLLTIVYPVVVGTLFVFAYPLIMFQGLSAVDALKRSTELVLPKFWGFLGFLAAGLLIHVVASSVGGVLVCVGTLILSPLAMALVVVAQVLAYRDFVGLDVESVAAYR